MAVMKLGYVFLGIAFSVLFTAFLMKRNEVSERGVKVLAIISLICSVIGLGCTYGAYFHLS